MNGYIEAIVVGAVIIRDDRVLLLQRREDDTFPGMWELPSGKLEPQEGPRRGLHREVKEETGLSVIGAQLTFAFEYIVPKAGVAAHTVQLTYMVETDDTLATRSEEHQALVWVPHSKLSDYVISEETRRAIDMAFAAPSGGE